MVRAMADGQSVALAVEIDGSVPPVLGDPVRLRQVVWNLLTNAIKCTPAGGRIVTSVSHVGGHARIQVRDTGVGIEPHYMPRIFDMFGQAGATRHGGLGLGLTIVRHVVEQHRGTVQAASPGAGQGATFTVTMPVIEPVIEDGVVQTVAGPKRMRADEEHRAAVGPIDLNDVRVLVVEDQLETREPLVEMLAASGAKVQAATSAAEAMRIFAAFRPQLLLSDIDMPIEDGHTLIRRIRALGPTRGGSVRAMALTAMASVQDRERALASGFDMHFAKPVKFDQLADALMALLHTP
jgi:two-component system CheB/CheR fusion protein